MRRAAISFSGFGMPITAPPTASAAVAAAALLLAAPLLRCWLLEEEGEVLYQPQIIIIIRHHDGVRTTRCEGGELFQPTEILLVKGETFEEG